MASITRSQKEIFLFGTACLAVRDAGNEKFSLLTETENGVFKDSGNNFYDLAKLESLFVEQKQKAAAEKDPAREKLHADQLSLVQTFKMDALNKKLMNLSLLAPALNLERLPLQILDDPGRPTTLTDVKAGLKIIESTGAQLARSLIQMNDNTTSDTPTTFSKCKGSYFAVVPNLSFGVNDSSAVLPGINLKTREWAVLSILYRKPSAKVGQTHAVFKRIAEEPQLQCHPNLVKIHGVYECQIMGIQMSHCWMKMCAQGTAYDRWFAGNEFLSFTEGKKLFSQMIDALQALHSYNIVHRDVKGDNIFIDEDVYKLADFDLSHCFKDPNEKEEVPLNGTIDTIAPEVAFQGDSPNIPSFTLKQLIRADVYELGASLFELGTKNSLPWHMIANSYRDLKILSFPNAQQGCDHFFTKPEENSLMHLIWRCVRFNPDERPTLQELKENLLKTTK